MKRREFSELAILGFPGIYFTKVGFGQDTRMNYPFRTLPEAFRAIGFDPKKKGNSFFVVTADVHYGSAGDGMMTTVEDVNKMNPKPAFFCVNGDLIVHASTHFGAVPDENSRQAAIDEFQQFKADVDKLNHQVPLKLTLGNHDTHPQEIDPILFWEVFPGYPAYQSIDLEGVHLIFLNGHSTGYIDTEQMQWLEKDVNSIEISQEVIIFVHQPSMSRRVRERGIPAAISKAFENHKGQIWLIGGHQHKNSHEIFKLKNTKLIEHRITCGTIRIWGGPEKPGYWIYCLHQGEVVGRIFKQRTEGYRIESLPELTSAQAVPIPFDNCDSLIWKILVGEGDRTFLIESKAEDCLNYWAYVKSLTYRLPLIDTNNLATKLAVLAEHQSDNVGKPGQYWVSLNLEDWQEIPLQEAKVDLLILPIPSVFQKTKNIYFKFIPSGEAAVAGFALVK
ncbi:MAG: hypothetical protein DHS20C17_00670 [Cyclobacteriaceae bacterium]|nr:MAG: hypothetical protein DHS20C17_00670 [Cyclobacteriaceae bacterium]